MSGFFSTNGRLDEIVVNQIIGSGSMSITLRPASAANRCDGASSSAASTCPSRTHCHSGVRFFFAPPPRGAFEILRRLGGYDARDLLDDLDLVAVDVEAALLEQQPVVEAGMMAARCRRSCRAGRRCR